MSLRPAYRRIRGAPAPLLAFERLWSGERDRFLYESLEQPGTRGRYSFAGARPRATFRARGREIEIARRDGRHEAFEAHPIEALRSLVQEGQDALPVATFAGGAVGYFGYDVVRSLAPVPDRNPDDLGLPDAQFVVPEEIVVFDHLDQVVHVLSWAEQAPARRVDEIAATLAACGDEPVPPGVAPPARVRGTLRSNVSAPEFERAVRAAQRHIRAGDIFQVVLSQRFDVPLEASPLALYAALREANPSPYMYYLDLDGVQLAGSSPEILVKLSGNRVTTRPLAGTRPRGRTPDEDARLATELAADPKERAEHVMLVDLARNDIGRVCAAGSIRVESHLEVERYARVMHLVSGVTGRLRDDRDAFDLFAATFPAGTVTGAPKVRAMQIIDDLEPVRRGPYAGAIGYFSFLGDMDLCIAIRTLVVRHGRAYLQVGAGIVADSVPEREYEETLNKARGLMAALES